MSPHQHKAEVYLAMIVNYLIALIAAIQWALVLDWMTKAVTLCIAIIGFLYMRMRHKQDMKNKKIEEDNLRLTNENLQQQQYQLLAKNKLLNTINKQTEQTEEKDDLH